MQSSASLGLNFSRRGSWNPKYIHAHMIKIKYIKYIYKHITSKSIHKSPKNRQNSPTVTFDDFCLPPALWIKPQRRSGPTSRSQSRRQAPHGDMKRCGSNWMTVRLVKSFQIYWKLKQNISLNKWKSRCVWRIGYTLDSWILKVRTPCLSLWHLSLPQLSILKLPKAGRQWTELQRKFVNQTAPGVTVSSPRPACPTHSWATTVQGSNTYTAYSHAHFFVSKFYPRQMKVEHNST